MTKILHKPIIYQSTKATHEETGVGDYVDPMTIALSDRAENSMQAVAGDGLYVGPYLTRQTYYVAASGTDDNSHGDEATPFKTLDFCIGFISGQGLFKSNVYIALKAGETFTLTRSLALFGGRIGISFYGDPQYGNFYGPLINGTTRPAYMTDLQRPVINVGLEPSTTGTAGFVVRGDMYAYSSSVPSEIELIGVRINLPGGPHATGQIDFVTCENGGSANLRLLGSIINITDTTTTFGLLGITADSKAYLYQYASQLLVTGNQVVAGDSIPRLTARSLFLKFYPDFAGNHQNGLDTNGGSPGSGLMELSWTDVSSLPVAASKTNLASYPVLNDPAVGLTNYFFNLTRDQQQRPLNCWSSRLF